MPHGQEKSVNQEKSENFFLNDKSQVKMGVFKKSQEKSGKNGGFWKKSGKNI